MKNSKKTLYISLFTLDILITIVLFVISIIMLATMPANAEELEKVTGFIGYLQQNPGVFLGAVVVPLFILLGINIAVLFVYVKKTTQKKKVALTDLSEEEKEALKKELLKDIDSK